MTTPTNVEFVDQTTIISEAWLDGINDWVNGWYGVMGETFTAASARTAFGAAKSGANTDITSLDSLTTPLSVNQGGTGGTIGAVSTMAFSSVIAIPDSVTRYIGAAVASSSETDAWTRVPFSGTIIGMFTQVPGAATGTRTYTVMVNGVDTAITAASTGASTQASDVTHTAAVVAGDRVTIKLVTSNGSDTLAHIVTLAIKS